VCELDSYGSKQGTNVSPCEHSNEPLGFLKYVECLDQVKNYQRLNDTTL